MREYYENYMPSNLKSYGGKRITPEITERHKLLKLTQEDKKFK